MHGAAPLLFLLAFSAVSALPRPLPARASAVDHQKPRYSVVPLEPSSDQPGGGNDDDGTGSGNGNGNGGGGGKGLVTVTRTVVETEVPVTVTRTAVGATTVTRELATTISIVDIKGPATATVTATVTAKPISSSSSSSQPLVPPAVTTRLSMSASGAHSSATLIMTTATPSEISSACATPAVTAAAAISPMGQIGPGTGSLSSSSVLVTAVSPHLSSGHTFHASALSSAVGSWNGTVVSYRFRRQ